MSVSSLVMPRRWLCRLSVGLLAVAAVEVRAIEPRDNPELQPDPLGLVAPSRGFDVLHTRLDLDVDLEGQGIAGSVTHRLEALADPLSRIAFNCVDLTVDEVRIDGAVVRFEHPVAEARSTSWLGGTEVTNAADQLLIYPATPVERGRTVEVEIRYHGSPRKGLYWIAPEKGIPEKRLEVWSQGEGEDNRYWIPLHDYPNDKATFEGIFRVPRGNYALSNGVLISREDVGDSTQFHWRLDQPQVSYLIMLAAGEYRVVEDEADGVPLLYVVPPGTDDETLARGYGITPDVMRFFNRTIGIPYPFGKYAQVVVQNFIYGGMENTTATVMNMRSLHDEGTALTRDSEGLVAHELAHQWWGDMVTCREWSHMWLNEGMTSYYTTLYAGHRHGEDHFRYAVLRRFDSVVRADKKDPRPLVVDFFNRRDDTNASNVYSKGASVLHMLRSLLGDERFHAVIKHYGETHRFEVVETADLARAVRHVTGENLDWFFEQWAYLQGHPVFAVSSRWDDTRGLLTVDLQQTQKRDRLTPVFRIPTTVEVHFADRTVSRPVVLDRAQQELHFEATDRPRMVVIDPAGDVLMQLEFDKTATELVYQLEHGSLASSVRAARALPDEGREPGVVPALASALAGERYWGLRREACTALGRIGTDAAVAAVIAGLGDGEAEVRLACTQALRDVAASKAVVDALQARQADDPAWEVRAEAVTSLVALRASGAKAACKRALAIDDHRGVVRRAGLTGLADLGGSKAIELVEPYTGPGNRRVYRHTAIEAFARLAKEQGKAKDKERAVRHLTGMLDDWYLRTRQAVIRALGTMGDDAAVPALRRLSRTDPLPEVRSLARTTADKLAAGGGDGDGESVADEVRALERRVADLEEGLSSVEKRVPR